MGIDFSSTSMLSLLAAPVQALAAWFIPAQNIAKPLRTPSRAQRKAQQMVLRFAPSATEVPLRPAIAVPIGLPSGKIAPKSSSGSQLRIVREFDSAVSPCCAGRMVISGRMADVCAELERMSQRETTTH